jgi:hypothetical protein
MFFKINNNDYSMYVNKLSIGKVHNYKSMTTAAGNTIVKYVNSKRTIEVGIIPLDDTAMKNILADINEFQVSISFRNPETNEITENLACIIPNNLVEYYTIQVGNVKYKAFSLQIKEL